MSRELVVDSLWRGRNQGAKVAVHVVGSWRWRGLDAPAGGLPRLLWKCTRFS